MIYIIKPENKVFANLLNDLQNLNPLKEWKVTIEPHTKNRSNQQNALMWKWISIISDHTGYHPDELHEGFKRNFIGVDIGNDIFGNTYIRPKSTT